MWSTEIPGELEPAVAPEFRTLDDPKLESEEETTEAEAREMEIVEREDVFKAGALGPYASARQQSFDDDDDSDLGSEDFDYEGGGLDEDELDEDVEEEEELGDDDLEEEVDDDEL